MIWSDFFGGFLGAFGGVAAGVLAVKFLGAKFIEHKLAKALSDHNHELAKQLATLQGGMSQLGDVLSRRNEREFAVVERAWELLIETFGLMQSHFGVSSKPVSHFKDMDDETADRFIVDLGFLDDDEKERLLHTEPEDRDALYERYELWRRYETDQNAWQVLKSYLNTHEIFFSQAIFTGFKSVQEHLLSVLVEVEFSFHGYTMTVNRIALQEKLNEIEGKVSALSSAVRNRFGFKEE